VEHHHFRIRCFREEETRSKTSFFVKAVGNRKRDSGLAGAGHAVEPKDALITATLTPFLDLIENINSSTLKA
jgi:hypothetical protein